MKKFSELSKEAQEKAVEEFVEWYLDGEEENRISKEEAISFINEGYPYETFEYKYNEDGTMVVEDKNFY